MNATTTKTVSEDTILGFVKRHAGEAVSSEYDKVKDSASRAAALGFTQGATVKLAGFLDDFRPDPEIKAYYEEHYPQCFFLTWRGLRRVLKSLNLWCDLPQHYAGGVPDEQLPWLEVFERRDEDAPDVSDMMEMLKTDNPLSERDEVRTEMILRFHSRGQWSSHDLYESAHRFSVSSEEMRRFHQSLIIANGRVGSESQRIASVLEQAIREFCDSYMVVAPAGAFTTDKDWITRTREMVTTQLRETKIVDDPLVIRPVRHGALVVAAWGDEAKEINSIANNLNL